MRVHQRRRHSPPPSAITDDWDGPRLGLEAVSYPRSPVEALILPGPAVTEKDSAAKTRAPVERRGTRLRCASARQARGATPLWAPKPPANNRTGAHVQPGESVVAAPLCRRTPYRAATRVRAPLGAPWQAQRDTALGAEAAVKRPNGSTRRGWRKRRRRSALPTHSIPRGNSRPSVPWSAVASAARHRFGRRRRRQTPEREHTSSPAKASSSLRSADALPTAWQHPSERPLERRGKRSATPLWSRSTPAQSVSPRAFSRPN